MTRAALVDLIRAHRPAYDVIIIGGGATGAGLAWDAASRGLSALLLEGADFGEGTSSRSTKLIHGGIRYLAQGRIGLVFEALRERQRLLSQAHDHVTPLPFVIPVETAFEALKYRAGLTLYGLLAGAGRATWRTAVDPVEARKIRPSLRAGRRGLLQYLDAQFDDTRLLFAVLARAVTLGAHVLNYARVVAFMKRQDGRLAGVVFEDRLTGAVHEISATAIINAAGPAAPAVVALDRAADRPALTLSRGSHVVVSREFWPHRHALLMPRTPDGRVMFAIPWHDRLVLGTTDIATTADAPLRATTGEVSDILAVTARYLTRAPAMQDISACFAGVRPLAGAASLSTARVSREYQLSVADSGLVSLYGGKWTTFRRMAEVCVDATLKHHRLRARRSATVGDAVPASGSLLPPALRSAADAGAPAAGNLPLATGFAYRVHDVQRAIREEMAHSVADLLARRMRLLFLDVRAARALAPRMAALLAAAHGRDAAWITAELARFAQAAEAFEVPAGGVPASQQATGND